MKTIEHCIPKAINPQAVLDAWQRHSGHLTHSVGRSLLTHHVLSFTFHRLDSANEEELAGFISGYVAACEDQRKAALDRVDSMLHEIFADDDDTLILSDDNAAPLGWDSVDTSTDDDSPQMMPSPDQFR